MLGHRQANEIDNLLKSAHIEVTGTTADTCREWKTPIDSGNAKRMKRLQFTYDAKVPP